ncbi:disease resistance RPP13-like protein 4 [Solanum verrucosum]|uniref:disease resistance RPP13-like protein 4 n=1 Tax=Solanum verrucosum TaxID=315347 RepID=UPI0020D131BC|nr:disease resistance RPP13-like protein 4 [Solanum verrucosum]
MATAINHVSSHTTEIQREEEEHLPRATSAPQQEVGNQQTTTDHEMKAKKLHELMEDDIQFIDEAYDNLRKYKAEVVKQQERAKEMLKYQEISKVEKVVMRLKTEIPSKVKVRYSEPTDRDAKKKEILPNREKNKHLAGVHSFYKKDLFKNNVIFKEFKESFNLLDSQHKQCLLCFALFPKDATIKKRIVMYWWIGEGFIPSDVNAKAETESVLNQLILRNFIHPVYDKCPFKKKAHSCKLQPLAHAAVTMLAESENFIDFDDKGDPIREHTRSLRSCLVPRKDNKLENEESNGKNNSNSQTTSSYKPMAHVVFNLNEAFLRLKREWFTEMKHVSILYLGGWDSTSKKHIEVEEPKDLEGLANIKYVKFLSLQGISGITEIPESISKLWNLNVLDLRACHSLEVIPRGIGSLHNLTHLDLSECYLLSSMPKGLGALTNLVVLKGFEVQDSTDKLHSCTLDDLSAMKNLSKLSIHTEIVDFPRRSELSVLKKFKQLRILTIEWGGNLLRNPDPSTASNVPKPEGIARKLPTGKKADENVSHPTGFLPKLEKLDLKCYPRRSAATWLKPDNLPKLSELYIRGGELRDLGQFEFGTDPEPWNNVETLRLKYLTEMEMDWTEFRELFPKVECLEKVKCPKLTMFPCNAHGVWKDKS